MWATWKIPILNQCCCGCSLKKGSIIIGVLGIVHGLATITETVLQCDSCLTTYKFNTGERTGLELVPVAEVIHGCVLVLFGAALVLGSIMEVSHVVWGWLLARTLLSLLTLFLVPVSVGFRVAAKDTSAPILLAAGVVEIGLDVYFLLVVYSFYHLIAGKDAELADF
ncbi:uncharacterized protein LOC126172807 [Schistocerca cancellata]|uniref:uncharacterized protein LOC126172807 n=1 Tax=Schistocerca cancellata TaxID=274614 RepID=UPI002117DF1F|nr:uncharacterized protein LOC126172807 [Schistocerca cancellata]